jgi:exopolyphosphatase/guanosine-5'-triphosphate,3'-diphosphate pyrophosphatase
MSTRLAAIDLGTVTARLLVADVDSSGIVELERGMRITHLGEDLAKTGMIGGSAIEREVAACREFLAAVEAWGRRDGRPVDGVVTMATSAMRDARNSRDVCDALSAIGLDVEIISGGREARLSFTGTISGFLDDTAMKGQPVLTADVGGGSTELILGMVDNAREPHILKARSFDIGSRRVTDRFLRDDPPSATGVARAIAWTKDEMRGYFADLTHSPRAMIAVAGTAVSAVSVREAMEDYDPWKVHASTVTMAELDKVLYELAKLDLAARKAHIGLEPERASVIVGGLLVLHVVLELVGLDSFTVSETDILHGMLLDAALSKP